MTTSKKQLSLFGQHQEVTKPTERPPKVEIVLLLKCTFNNKPIGVVEVINTKVEFCTTLPIDEAIKDKVLNFGNGWKLSSNEIQLIDCELLETISHRII